MIVAASRLESGGRGEDRLVVERWGDRLLIVVADGAGGIGGGALAAQGVCDAAVAMFRSGDGDAWPLRLERIDSMLVAAGHGGQSTAVVVEIVEARLTGASVGDSAAWLVSGNAVTELTEFQVRKPLLGSGAVRPAGFGPLPVRGRLIVGTDGLFRYASRPALCSAVTSPSQEEALTALIEAIRMPSGQFQDDVGVVVCDVTG
jgi:serine/threonine protein phosphatase PrpC